MTRGSDEIKADLDLFHTLHALTNDTCTLTSCTFPKKNGVQVGILLLPGQRHALLFCCSACTTIEVMLHVHAAELLPSAVWVIWPVDTTMVGRRPGWHLWARCMRLMNIDGWILRRRRRDQQLICPTINLLFLDKIQLAVSLDLCSQPASVGDQHLAAMPTKTMAD